MKAKVLVGKYELAQGNNIAVFFGDGFNLAEKLIKAENSKYEILPTKEKVS